MKPLVVLLASFIIATIVIRFIRNEYDIAFSARIAMCIMLCFTAVGHFAFTEGMSMMIPPFVPFKSSIVLLTGVLEIVMGIGLLIPRFQVLSGWALIAFLVLMLPGNVYAAMHHINFEKGTFDGPGLAYLWFRVPLQVFFIGWVYRSAIKSTHIVSETVLVH